MTPALSSRSPSGSGSRTRTGARTEDGVAVGVPEPPACEDRQQQPGGEIWLEDRLTCVFLGCHAKVVCSVFVWLLHGSEILILCFFSGGALQGLLVIFLFWLLHGADNHKLLFLFFHFLFDPCAGLQLFFFSFFRAAARG